MGGKMKKNKSFISIFLVTVMLLSFFNFTVIKKATADEREIYLLLKSDNIISMDSAKRWAKDNKATDVFIGLADLYWKYYKKCGNVDPALAYVQAAHETGFGRFGGVVDESYHNPCGMKVPNADHGSNPDDSNKDPNKHYRFNNWDEGVQAHLDHLALYAGAKGYPKDPSETFDPKPTYPKGGYPTLKLMAQKWAYSPIPENSMKYYDKLYKFYTDLESYEAISTLENVYQSGSNIVLHGWALDRSGVEQIKVFVDNTYVGNASYGAIRQDVANIYTNYPNALRSGFNFETSVAGLKDGNHSVKVIVNYNNGYSETYIKTVNITKPKSIVCIDKISQDEGSNHKAILSIKGWSIDFSGVEKVEIYIDGKYVQDAKINGSRPDVQTAYPDYINSGKSGFEAVVDVNSLSEDYHSVKIRSIGKDGTKTDVDTSIRIINPKPRIYVDNLKQVLNSSKNSVVLNGWALHKSGVKNVNVYIDGEYSGAANYGSIRADVKAAFPIYPNADKSGYSYEVSANNLSQGSHDITIEVVGNDDTSIKYDSRLDIIKPDSIICVDNFKQQIDSKNENVLYISGWSVDSSSVEQVQIFIDGQYKANAEIGKSRPDVYNAYPSYSNSDKSGFNVSINADSIGEGYHTVKIRSIGKDGTKTDVDTGIKIVDTKPRIYVDILKQNVDKTKNSILVRGWALHKAGVKQVKVYIDGNYSGDATYGSIRADVKSAFPIYPNGDKSGYSYEVSASNLSKGSHEITIEVVGNDDTTERYTSNIDITKMEPILCVDTIKQQINLKNENELYISGWSIDSSSVEQVQIFIDGKYKQNALIGGSRPDVGSVYSGYANSDKSGFSISLDAEAIGEGYHSIKITSVGKDGTKIDVDTRINIISAKPKLCIDNYSFIDDGKSISISGWAIASPSIEKINIYVNDKFYGVANYGITRGDVKDAYPIFPNAAYSGFNASIDSSNATSIYKIRLEAIDVNGNIAQSSGVTLSKSMIVIDPGHLGHDSGAVRSNVKESDLNTKVAVKLQQELEKQGYNVEMTRNPLKPNEFVSLSTKEELKQRYDFANGLKADLFISLHHDVSTNSSTQGIWTFYSSWKPGLKDVKADKVPLKTGFDGYADTKPTKEAILGKEFANKVTDNIASKCNYKKIRSSAVDRNLSVTVHTKMPAVLLELGMMSNSSELKRCQDPVEQQKKAEAIAETVSSMF